MTRRLVTFGFCLIAGPRYLAACGYPEAVGDLADHRFLHHRYSSRGRLEAWPLSRTVNLPVTAVASAIEPLVVMAGEDLGIACFPTLAVRDQLERGDFVAILAGATGGTREFRAVWPSSSNMSPKVRAFVDFLATYLLAEQVSSKV